MDTPSIGWWIMLVSTTGTLSGVLWVGFRILNEWIATKIEASRAARDRGIDRVNQEEVCTFSEGYQRMIRENRDDQRLFMERAAKTQELLERTSKCLDRMAQQTETQLQVSHEWRTRTSDDLNEIKRSTNEINTLIKLKE